MQNLINFFKKLFGVKPQAIVKDINRAKSAATGGIPPDPTHPKP